MLVKAKLAMPTYYLVKAMQRPVSQASTQNPVLLDFIQKLPYLQYMYLYSLYAVLKVIAILPYTFSIASPFHPGMCQQPLKSFVLNTNKG